MGCLLEYDCVLPRGEEFEEGAVGFCGQRRKITGRDETHRGASARTCTHAADLPICMHAACPCRH